MKSQVCFHNWNTEGDFTNTRITMYTIYCRFSFSITLSSCLILRLTQRPKNRNLFCVFTHFSINPNLYLTKSIFFDHVVSLSKPSASRATWSITASTTNKTINQLQGSFFYINLFCNYIISLYFSHIYFSRIPELAYMHVWLNPL